MTDHDIPEDMERFFSSPIRESSEGDLIPPDEMTLEDLHDESIVNVTTLNDLALITRYAEARDALIEMKEAMSAKTQEGRDLQSVRTACLIEMAKRGLR